VHTNNHRITYNDSVVAVSVLLIQRYTRLAPVVASDDQALLSGDVLKAKPIRHIHELELVL
jgi:hypothetical protein